MKATASGPLSPFYSPSSGMDYNGLARSFPVWSHSFPCGQLEDDYAMRTRKSATEGLFYVRLIEASSATFSSVTARIARKMGQRQYKKQEKTANHISEEIHENMANRTCTARVASPRGRRFHDRTREQSFLWSVVREPVSRLVSKFYHYSNIGRKTLRGQTTLDRFQNFVFNSQPQDYGYYYRSLGVSRNFNPYNKEHEKDTREVLESYDFLGVSERIDESLAVLKIILDLDIQDILYLPMESAGPKSSNSDMIDGFEIDYYENWRGNECRPIPKSKITFEMKEWFYSEEFEALIEADVMFYKAVNASLDKTIAELGRDLVERTVRELRLAQKQVEEKCQSIKFPCSSDGKIQKETDCLFSNSNIGCGYKCLDTLEI